MAYSRTWGRIHYMEKKDPDVPKILSALACDREQTNDADSMETFQTNPFGNHFNTIIDNVENKISNATEKATCEPNRSYCPQFLQFIKSYLPEMPLWSGVLLGSLDRHRGTADLNACDGYPYLSFKSSNAKSEGYIEGAMRHLKQEDFPGKKRLRADAFVSENYKRIRRRVNDFADRIHSNLLPKKKRTYRKKEGKSTTHSVSPDPINSKQPEKENYHTAHETWGKKDPDTPRTNPKLGQFQQSPVIPLSRTPEVKAKKRNRTRGKKPVSPTSGFLVFLRQNRGRLFRKYRDMSKVNKEASEMWRTLSHESKQKYSRKAANEKDIEITVDKDKTISRDGLKKNVKRSTKKRLASSNTDTPKDKKTIYKGLHNKGNDCWLNSLIQCINSVPLKRLLIPDTNRCVSPVISALINTLRTLDDNIHEQVYPTQLHKVFQNQFHYIPGAQNDIHEAFTSLCSGDDRFDNVVKKHFQGTLQYRKACSQCKKIEEGLPETFTNIFLSLSSSIKNMNISIAESLHDITVAFCDECATETIHNRQGTFLFLPETLLITFKRFDHSNGHCKKIHSDVRLAEDIDLIADKLFHYRLNSCALHHGRELNIGHYTALVCESNNVIEIDDTYIRDVSQNWQNLSSKTVYMAFYSLVTTEPHVFYDKRERREIEPKQTSEQHKDANTMHKQKRERTNE